MSKNEITALARWRALRRDPDQPPEEGDGRQESGPQGAPDRTGAPEGATGGGADADGLPPNPDANPPTTPDDGPAAARRAARRAATAARAAATDAGAPDPETPDPETPDPGALAARRAARRAAREAAAQAAGEAASETTAPAPAALNPETPDPELLAARRAARRAAREVAAAEARTAVQAGERTDPAPADPAEDRPSQEAAPQDPTTTPAAAPTADPAAQAAPVAQVPPARVRLRHHAALASFAALVIAPSLGALAYLYLVAADQYASRTVFSVRSAESVAPIEFLGALTQSVTSAGADSEIIYQFVRSQPMVEAAMAALPLETMWNLPADDVVFRLGEDQPIEDVLDHWNRMVDVSFDAAAGIVHVEARAFAPDDARAIAAFVLDESTRIVNAISTQAREDAVAVSRGVLDQAEERLRTVRREIRAFRDAEQEFDPSQNARAALGLMATLREQLAAAQVELDSYLALVGPRGPRAPALRQRIESLGLQLEAERRRLGAGEAGAGAADGDEAAPERRFSQLAGDYEELTVELEFAQNAYVSALSAYEQAQVEARRQMRFLAPHIRPSLSVEAEYPQRALIAAALFAALTVAWSVLLLIAYNIRDRR